MAQAPAAPRAGVMPPEAEVLLDAQIQDAHALLVSLEGLETHLTALAQKALDDADAAPTPDERRRYEQLYTETSARLGELQATRAALQGQLERLETQRETLSLGH